VTFDRGALVAVGAFLGGAGLAVTLLLLVLVFTSASSNSYGGDYGVGGLLFLAAVLPTGLAGAAIGGVAAWRLTEPGQRWQTRPIAALTMVLFAILVVGCAVALYLDL